MSSSGGGGGGKHTEALTATGTATTVALDASQQRAQDMAHVVRVLAKWLNRFYPQAKQRLGAFVLGTLPPLDDLGLVVGPTKAEREAEERMDILNAERGIRATGVRKKWTISVEALGSGKLLARNLQVWPRMLIKTLKDVIAKQCPDKPASTQRLVCCCSFPSDYTAGTAACI